MPIDADIVYQRVAVPDAERCDLVIATNVLLYYDAFEQMLAVLNITAMLAPGGLLLTNTKLDDLPAFPLRRVAETATAFSDRPGDGEYVVRLPEAALSLLPGIPTCARPPRP